MKLIDSWSRFCSHVAIRELLASGEIESRRVHARVNSKQTAWPQVRPSTLLVSVIP
jgi:hypothetical protein